MAEYPKKTAAFYNYLAVFLGYSAVFTICEVALSFS